MVKVIIGSQGKINVLLARLNEFEFVSAAPFGDGKVMLVVKGEPGDSDFAPGEVIIKEVIKEVEVEVIKEVIKKVPYDNPELLDQIQTLQDALSDALNAEEKAKKEAEDLKKQIPKMKAQIAKLKKAIVAED